MAAALQAASAAVSSSAATGTRGTTSAAPASRLAGSSSDSLGQGQWLTSGRKRNGACKVTTCPPMPGTHAHALRALLHPNLLNVGAIANSNVKYPNAKFSRSPSFGPPPALSGLPAGPCHPLPRRRPPTQQDKKKERIRHDVKAWSRPPLDGRGEQVGARGCLGAGARGQRYGQHRLAQAVLCQPALATRQLQVDRLHG